MPFNNGQFPSMKSVLNNMFDSLNKFLIIVLLILLILTLFIRNFFLDLAKFVILGIIIFRISSKNKLKRVNENKYFTKTKNIILKPFSNISRNIKDKNHVYKKCSKCKTILKLPLPSKIGLNHAKCPNCKNRVTLFSLKKKKEEKIKVEVIKKNR